MSATMTPPSPRTKRHSKAPNRFSSDNSRIEISSSTSPGETNIDYNDNSTSTTHNLPTNRAMKLKAPAIRDPLKIKLPKLKRPAKEETKKADITTIKLSKIKLPFQLSSDRRKNETKTGSSPPRIKISLKKNKKEAKDMSPEKLAELVRHEDTSDHCKPIDDQCDEPVGEIANGRAIESDLPNNNLTNDPVDSNGGGQCQREHAEPKDSENPNDLAAESGIRCPCGVNVDFGVMVECESCLNWQHVHCINGGSEDGAYEGYICAFCSNTTGQSTSLKD